MLAVLSINLGVLNLLPVPVLDGGQLVFYAAEALRGRPLGDRAQEYAAMVGLALSQLLAMPSIDAFTSIAIGVILGVTSVGLGRRCYVLQTGLAADPAIDLPGPARTALSITCSSSRIML